MRLLVDLQGAQTESRFRGIGRYTTGLVRAIASSLTSSGDELWILLNDRFVEAAALVREQLKGLVPPERIRGFDVPMPVAASHHDDPQDTALANGIRNAAIAALQPHVTLVTSLFEGFVDDAVTSVGPPGMKCVVILYDLIPLAMPDDYLVDPRVRRWYERRLAELRRADLLLAISDQSRNEAIRLIDYPAERIRTIGAGLDDRFFTPFVAQQHLERLLASLRIHGPFVLYVGGFDRRKNVDTLVDAYARLPASTRETYQLVLAGRVPGGVESNLRAIAEGDGDGAGASRLVFTDYISDDDLVLLYRAARLLVFPSTSEGFGFPVLEALACGTPILAARSPSIEDLLSDERSLYTHGVEDLAARLADQLADRDAPTRSKALFDSHRDDFRWAAVADRAVDALRDVCRDRAGADVRSTTAGATADAADVVTLARSWARARVPSIERLVSTALAVSRVVAPPRPARLYVDVTSIAQEDLRTGIQRVVRAMLLELLKLSPRGLDVVPVRADPDAQVYRQATAYLDRLFDRSAPSGDDDVIDVDPGDVFLGLDLAHSATFMVRWFRIQKARGLFVSFVAYDLLPVLQPQFFPPGAAGIFATWLEVLAKLGDAVYCISQAVADDFVEYLDRGRPTRRTPISVGSFRLGADLHATAPTRGLPADAGAVLESIRSRPTFLMVGTIEPRKGHAQVTAAFDELWAADRDVGLVIVGKAGWLPPEFFERLRTHAELGRRLRWLERISDEYLDAVYESCTALIAASEGEGFGLPLIEAAAKHLPIIARDIPVFREVAADHAFYFHGTEPESLVGALSRWLSMHEAGTVPTSDGIEATTWSDSGSQLAGCIDGTRPLRDWHGTSSVMPGERLGFDSLKLDFEGWSFIEATHRWNDGRHARIGFRLPIHASWTGRVLLELATSDEQRIVVRYGDRVLWEARVLLNREPIEFQLPLDDLRFDRDSWIDLDFPDAAYRNSLDRRLLAAQLISVTIS